MDYFYVLVIPAIVIVILVSQLQKADVKFARLVTRLETTEDSLRSARFTRDEQAKEIGAYKDRLKFLETQLKTLAAEYEKLKTSSKAVPKKKVIK